MRRLLAALPLTAGLALSLPPRPADACQYANCQSEGAVTKPGDFAFSLPFMSGEKVQVLSGYGPNAGSSLHCRAQDSSCANDWHALDLVLPDHPNWGKGQAIVAAASGKVIAAGWGTSGWAAYGRRVYIEHDYKADGHKYVTMYAHLDSVDVSVGQQVAMGQTIGTLGGSCNEADSCGNFSTPHLHFALHRDSNFGGSGSGGSYGGRATKPEPIDGYTDLTQGDVLISKNGDEEPPPPMECLAIPPEGATLEDDGPCITLGGAPENYGEIDGNGGHAFHTALDTPSPDYAEGGIWILTFEQAGTYELEAFVPSGLPSPASQATYKIAHGGQSTKEFVDHAAALGSWVSLGTYDFALGEGQWVRLGDNFDLDGDNGRRIAIDALRVTPSDACECADEGAIDTLPCGVGGEQTRICDGCAWGRWSQCNDGSTTSGTSSDGSASDSDSTGGSSSGSTGGDGSDTGGTPSGTDGTGGTGGGTGSSGGVTSLGTASATAGASGFDPGADDTGCTCVAAERSAPPSALLLLLTFVRRRRRRCASPRP